MSISAYSINLLEFQDVKTQKTPDEFLEILKTWRSSNSFSNKCTKCDSVLHFGDVNFVLCCQQFYHVDSKSNYLPKSIAVRTPKYSFQLPYLERCLKQHKIKCDQEFIVFPDPIYWQITTTLVYEKIIKFVKGLPVNRRTDEILPPEKAAMFYKQAQEAPLNLGSFSLRSCGKNTFMRQYVFGKRCVLAMRGTISADSDLQPSELRVPERLKYLLGRHVLVNRMPSLQPENVIDLRVAKTWEHDCFGLPLEVLESLHADFDGDEINVWILESLQAQAECMFLLNSQMEMGSKTIGLKLAPCQDMLVVFYLNYDKINFLPYKDPNRNLRKTFRVIYDLYGSRQTYECIDTMRRYYLDVMENEMVFSITLEEILQLIRFMQTINSYEEFENNAPDGNLIVQVKSGAKGTLYHLYQMFKCIGPQSDGFVQNSFWTGLEPWEAVLHAKISCDALLQTGKIWEPGYGYSKNVFNLQDLHVDYSGQLVDGKIVIERDVLLTMDSSLILCHDAFKEILKRKLISNEDDDETNKMSKTE